MERISRLGIQKINRLGLSREKLVQNQNKEPGSILFLEQNKFFAVKVETLLKFQIKGETRLFDDPTYKIELASSNSKLKISTKSWVGENEYLLYTSVFLERPDKVKLYISVDGVKKHTFDIEFIDSKDVFTKEETNRLKDEFLYISTFVNNESPTEYAHNYCLSGADRALGKLLNNKSDFYVVERGTHNVLNFISFANKNTYSRAKEFESKGFIEISYIIDTKYWTVDHNKRKQIMAATNYVEAQEISVPLQYDITKVNLSQGSLFLSYLKKQIDSKEPGFHIYYQSIVDGFHTQVLVIDNTDRENPKYQIWEDYGLSSSEGNLDEIVNGIERQTSTMFNSSLLFKYRDGIKDKWDAQTYKIWKIKAK
jgi:hypothetical protein